MTDKELIKQEIEKQIDYAEDDTRYTESYREGLIAAYQTIKAFIDNSFPEEPTKEDLEEEIKNYFSAWLIDLDNHKGFLLQIARHFAEWGRNHFEDKSEMVSEDLEKEITKCYKSRNDLMMTRNQFGEIIHHFAKWQKQKSLQDFMEKAEKFFKNELYVSISDQICSHNNFTSMSNFIENFKNHMQDE